MTHVHGCARGRSDGDREIRWDAEEGRERETNARPGAREQARHAYRTRASVSERMILVRPRRNRREGAREVATEGTRMREDEEKEVYQLAESSLADWLPSPCLFFAVRFILFYSQASNTRTRPQVDTYRSGCFVEGDVIDRQIYPGEFRLPGETTVPSFSPFTPV